MSFRGFNNDAEEMYCLRYALYVDLYRCCYLSPFCTVKAAYSGDRVLSGASLLRFLIGFLPISGLENRSNTVRLSAVLLLAMVFPTKYIKFLFLGAMLPYMTGLPTVPERF